MSTKIKYVVAADTAALEQLQDRAVKSAHSARVMIQVAAVATLIHIAKHGDYTGANRLVHGLGNSVNGASLVEFFKKYGGLTIDEGATEFTGWSKSEYIENHLDDAKSTMWWELRKVNPFKGYSAEAELLAFIKKHKAIVSKLQDMPKDDQEKVSIAVSDNTIRAVLSLVNFDVILDDVAGNDVEQLAYAS